MIHAHGWKKKGLNKEIASALPPMVAAEPEIEETQF